MVALVALLTWAVGRLVQRRALEDTVSKYYLRKSIKYVAVGVAFIAIAIIWRAFAGEVSVVLGLFAAGVAFALQEVIGAFAGWFNILFGRIYRVGDRVQIGSQRGNLTVRGDVIDITPLRTTILEIGDPQDDMSWIRGRQYTGRIVTVSNKMTFTEPVHNYTAHFEYLWEELILGFPYRADWHAAETIMLEEVRKASMTSDARTAMDAMARRYPVPRVELEPRIYTRATDNWMELSARFVVPVRTSRGTKDAITRSIRDRLDAAGIELAVPASEVAVRIIKDPSPDADAT